MYALSLVLTPDQVSPTEVIDVLLHAIRYADNSSNKVIIIVVEYHVQYSDNYYLAVVVRALSNIRPTSIKRTAVLSDVCDQLSRSLASEKVLPFYHNTVCCAAIEVSIILIIISFSHVLVL